MKRLAFAMLAVAIAALACRNGQPANDPTKPEPNSPLPKIEKPNDDDATKTTVPSPLKRDGG